MIHPLAVYASYKMLRPLAIYAIFMLAIYTTYEILVIYYVLIIKFYNI